MIQLSRILGQDMTPKSPVLSTHEAVVNDKKVDVTSEGVSKQNTLPYATILDHPNPVTK